MIEFKLDDKALMATKIGEDGSNITYNIFFNKPDGTWRVYIQETVNRNVPDLQTALDLCKSHSDRVDKRLNNDTETKIS